ncbi:MAG: membrane protein insertion efficiency factor YidD [Alphaproteobacteria bacterium]|nr:membrane protein insertion efficiency factor YidD [Alphaproteobacteria bacterium]
MIKILSYSMIFLIYFYRWIISPLLPNHCRFNPTCSQYALQALKEYGPWVGSFYILRRLSQCHPWGKSGYDPLPKK